MFLRVAIPQPRNKVVISSDLIDCTRRMLFVECCTFTFAQYHNPVRQWMYFCVTCKQRVCIVCRVSGCVM